MTAETVAARTQRQLAEAMVDSRRRTVADSTDPDVPVAATVIVVRDGAEGPEVLLIERPDRGSFAGAWVFPGGKVEESDAAGQIVTDAAHAEEQVARVAGVRETYEETGLVLDPDALVTVSRWDPPPGIPLRIRTWFFLAPAPGGQLALQAEEAVSAQWARPSDVLEKHGRGELTLYPPTWVTLDGLTGQPDLAALSAAVRLAGPQSFETTLRIGEGGPVFLWQGDAEYDADGADGADEAEDAASDALDTTAGQITAGQRTAGQRTAASARHRLVTGSLPWSYTKTS